MSILEAIRGCDRAGYGGSGAVTVKSENNTDASAMADASTFNPGASFDATTKVNYTNDTIDLGTGSGLNNGDQIFYRTNGGTPCQRCTCNRR